MENERWKDIEGYNGHYQISDCGRVMSYKNESYEVRKIGKLLSLYKSNNDYYRVRLYLSGTGKTVHIARLTALHFILNLENKPQINHKDGVKTNNHYANLEWVTASENIIHAYRVLHKKAPGGENHYRTRLTNEKVKEIRELYKTEQYTQKQLGYIFGVHRVNIGHIINNKSWKGGN